jgi:hypothetical protein
MKKENGILVILGSKRRVWLVIAGLVLVMLSVVLLTPAKVVYAAPGTDLSQCANGDGTPDLACTDANGAWVNGNLNENQAHYGEDDVVPYQTVLTDLTNGATYTYSFEWDTTRGGLHAIDYIMTYTETETDADACTGVLSAAECLVVSTIGIPPDQKYLDGFDQISGTGDDLVQPPGVITLYNGTLTAISGYAYSGSYADTSSTGITVTFTYTGATGGSAVLAWGGHIAWRGDWGANNSASGIQGSPYHMRAKDFTCSNVPNCSVGQQDRSLSAGAIALDTLITIRKNAVPD